MLTKIIASITFFALSIPSFGCSLNTLTCPSADEVGVLRATVSTAATRVIKGINYSASIADRIENVRVDSFEGARIAIGTGIFCKYSVSGFFYGSRASLSKSIELLRQGNYRPASNCIGINWINNECKAKNKKASDCNFQ